MRPLTRIPPPPVAEPCTEAKRVEQRTAAYGTNAPNIPRSGGAERADPGLGIRSSFFIPHISVDNTFTPLLHRGIGG